MKKEEPQGVSGEKVKALFLMCALFLSAGRGGQANGPVAMRTVIQEELSVEIPLNNVAVPTSSSPKDRNHLCIQRQQKEEQDRRPPGELEPGKEIEAAEWLRGEIPKDLKDMGPVASPVERSRNDLQGDKT
jgi:hypothetical protein